MYTHMDYIPFDVNNPNCLHVMLSNRAYCSIINETFEYGTDETGGLFLGFIIGRKWYIVDTIDPGTNNTIHQYGLFRWDRDYVNMMAQRMQKIYRYQPTILGFWHRHPGSMDFFSSQDEESTQTNLRNARKGLLSMLVNIDPALRMTFYYCNGSHFMPVRYDVGDEYFPVELLEYASPEEISSRHVHNQQGATVPISYRRVIQPPAPPGKEPRKSVRADNDAPVADAEPQQESPTPAAQPAETAPARQPEPEQTDTAATPVREEAASAAQEIPAPAEAPRNAPVETAEEAPAADTAAPENSDGSTPKKASILSIFERKNPESEQKPNTKGGKLV